MGILDELDDTYPADFANDVPLCDTCTTPFDTDEVIMYFSSLDYSYPDPHRDIPQLMRIYPPDKSLCKCDGHDQIRFPCEMANELLVLGTLTGGAIHPSRVLDHSPEGDGIPWDPIEVWQRIVGDDIRETSFDVEAHGCGPEDIVENLAQLVEVEIADVVDYTGAIEWNRKSLKNAAKQRPPSNVTGWSLRR